MDAQPSSLKNPSFNGIIGISREDITPPVGIYMGNWGAAKYATANGVHRQLTLTCLTFRASNDSLPLILLSADLGWWKNMEDEAFLRDGVIKALSLVPSQLMICLSHTHAGPSLCREDANKPGGEYVEPYLLHVQKTIIKAISDALAIASKATLTWQYGTCSLATNRDLPQSDEKRYVVGYNPAQPADDTLLVGRVSDEENRIIATIVNYACHPTTLAWDNALISPDYVGAMREVIESGTQAPCVFLQGASGQLAPSLQYTGDHSLADTYGLRLGYAALSTLEAMLPANTQLSFSGIIESGAPLAIWEHMPSSGSSVCSAQLAKVWLPLKELSSLADIEQQWEACEDTVLKERLWRKRGVRKAVGDTDVAEVPVWVWQLGDSFLIGQPNEAYSQFQQELRKSLAPFAVGVMNVVNGHIGYLPPRDLYEQNIYAVWQTPFDKGSLEILIETAVSVAHQMTEK